MGDKRNYFLSKVAKTIVNVLKKELPLLDGESWWDKTVLGKLSHNQRRWVEKNKVSSLSDLDIASLLRVFEKNWYDLEEQCSYPEYGRNYIHELMQLRNRLAHAGLKKTPTTDVYRDLDTLKRFSLMLQASGSLLNELDEELNILLKNMKESILPTSEFNSIKGNISVESELLENEQSELSSKKGVPIHLLQRGGGKEEEIVQLLQKKTFVGIDFGTSTTVVSYVKVDEDSRAITSEVIPITQEYEDGRTCDSSLLPSCIAWTGKKLLVGAGAVELKSKYTHGVNLWASFKMKLGVNLGPEYNMSQLGRNSGGPFVIEKAQDATVVVFDYLRDQVENFVEQEGLGEEIIYAISVPAAFEANQRQDLITALYRAGIELSEFAIIDEPNAAFLSFLLKSLKTGSDLAEQLEESSRKILVFDFGAGTCDISIIEVSSSKGVFRTRNLSISKFHAIGGNDVDRTLIQECLLPQFLEYNEINPDELSSLQKDNVLFPKIQKIAEDLKVQCCKYIVKNWNGRSVEPFIQSEQVFSARPLSQFHGLGKSLEMPKPSISLKQFAEIMQRFVDDSEDTTALNIFNPISNSLEKAGIGVSDLNMVLFIGGSSQNPFVQSAVQSYMGRFVDPIILPDLRTPVSRGVAVYSLFANGLGSNILTPITSESIYVLTRGERLRELIKAGASIPSNRVIIEDLEIAQDGQQVLELPICIGCKEKLLGVVKVEPPVGSSFKKNDSVCVSCFLDNNKMLNLEAIASGEVVQTILLNPRSNQPLSPKQEAMLKARAALNDDISVNKRPSSSILLTYALTCGRAGEYLKAAEAYEALERLDSRSNYAVSICYHYSYAGKKGLSAKWGKIAYDRHPTPVSAYNLALDMRRNDNDAEFIRLMEESLALDSEYYSALQVYGRFLQKRGEPRGVNMQEKALNLLLERDAKNDLDLRELSDLETLADRLGRSDIVRCVSERLKKMESSEMYNEQNLPKLKDMGQQSMEP